MRTSPEAAAARNRNRPSPSPPTSTTEEPNYELIDTLVAEAQVAPTEYEDLLDEGEDFGRPDAPPHVCVDDNADFKYKSLCFAFDTDMHEIILHASELSGYADQDGKCRYPLVGYSETKQEFHHLLSCSPLSGHCHVSCDLRWDSHESDQWACQSDYVQWIISFTAFVAVHALGTMLLISAAGLLNSSILSMAHEHSGFFGCQYWYAAMGFGIVPPVVTFLFQLIESLDIPW
ncbi:hypothetical protein Ocin01_06249 [Orchesella cincta]|uniref:Uncharacterized protein n=1 Tax=Orchesella cincta TaxID=48709 RepID=A0A1D2N579_ORCCI|nr:hypothetical protein Ocin01_06249 [Orchesella cincta]